MYDFRKLCVQDEEALTELLKLEYPLFNKQYWTWKYKKNPRFDPSLIVVGETEGKIIGCNHWLPRDFKLSRSLNVKTVLAGDLLVHPNHRGNGVAAGLITALRSSEAIKNNSIVLSYMFAPPKLNKRLYAPVAGYIGAPNSTSTYKKFFNCGELKEKIKLIDKRIKSNKDLAAKLKGLEISVLFRLIGIPSFTLQFEENGVSISEASAEKSNVIIEGVLPLSSALFDGKMEVRSLAKAWITGKLKVKKGFFTLVKLRRAFKVLSSANN